MRLIDADALMEKAWDADTRVGYVQVVDVGDIKDAPIVKPEPRWIPCSERLPDEEIQDYWVCLENGYQQQCRWMRYGHFYEWHTVAKVVAWMPLPEPYQGEGEQDG